jgi:hypothetical protein
MAKTSSQAFSFFGVLQGIYTLFASSTKRWQLLKKHVPSLSLKPVWDTRWESKIDSVQAIRYQTSAVRNALMELGETMMIQKQKAKPQVLLSTSWTSLSFWLA